jgi:hypothetical protein
MPAARIKAENAIPLFGLLLTCRENKWLGSCTIYCT